jgi:hypothetical protein
MTAIALVPGKDLIVRLRSLQSYDSATDRTSKMPVVDVETISMFIAAIINEDTDVPVATAAHTSLSVGANSTAAGKGNLEIDGSVLTYTLLNGLFGTAAAAPVPTPYLIIAKGGDWRKAYEMVFTPADIGEPE